MYLAYAQVSGKNRKALSIIGSIVQECLKYTNFVDNYHKKI